MAGAFLISAAVESLLSQAKDLISDKINNQINLASSFTEDLEDLSRTLGIIHALLHDADQNRKITSATMLEWLKNLKAVTGDAEDLLDELAYEAHRRKIEVQNSMMDKDLHNLKSIGHEFYGPATTTVFPALIEIKLAGMRHLEEWSDLLSSPVAATRPTEFFPRLQELKIYNCPKLITLPETAFKGPTSLQLLSIEECEELTCLPEGLMSSINIHIYDCGKLRMLTPTDETEAAFNGSTSLQQLWILHCPELTCLPKGLLQPTLALLWLNDCPELKAPNPDELRSITSLKDLCIRSCPNWVSCWEEGLFCTTSLQTLWIGEFGEEYRYFPWSHFTSLSSLCLWGWPEVKSLPDQLEHLPDLRDLKIRDFSGLESLPEWLGNLPSLQSLGIFGCPLVEKRCEKEIGEDWHKIAHIPSLQIGERIIQ